MRAWWFAPSSGNPDHLYLGTAAQNASDRDRNGAPNRGEANGQAVLTDAEVREIKALVRQGYSQRVVASRYDVSQQHVSKILSGKRRASSSDAWKLEVPRPLDLEEEFEVHDDPTTEFLITEPDDFMYDLEFEEAVTDVYDIKDIT